MIKKVLFFVLALIMVLSAYTFAYSGELTDKTIITGGFVDEDGELREKEATFDEKRTIAGLAPNDTQITITVSKMEDEELVVLDTYELTVGLSEMFSQTIDLHLGDNYVELAASSENEEFEYTCVITRKPSNIKSDLQNLRLLPWQTASGKTQDTK